MSGLPDLQESIPIGTPRRVNPWLLLLFVVIILAVVGVFAIKLTNNNLRISDDNPAPDFTIKTYDGSNFTLSQKLGKVVVINFWASWCGPCHSEAPELNALWDEYKDRGVVIIGVGYLDNEGDARQFIHDFGIQYLTGPDNGTSVSRSYHVSGVPETYVVDQNGKIAAAIPLPTNAKDLRVVLDKLLVP